MVDVFGDELFSVFESDLINEVGIKKDKEKDKGKWKGFLGFVDKVGKCFDGKL